MIAPVPISAETRAWLVRKLVGWGYLNSDDCVGEVPDEEETRKLGNAIARALPRLILEAERRAVPRRP
jgi:hypothetical protein